MNVRKEVLLHEIGMRKKVFRSKDEYANIKVFETMSRLSHNVCNEGKQV